MEAELKYVALELGSGSGSGSGVVEEVEDDELEGGVEVVVEEDVSGEQADADSKVRRERIERSFFFIVIVLSAL